MLLLETNKPRNFFWVNLLGLESPNFTENKFERGTMGYYFWYWTNMGINTNSWIQQTNHTFGSGFVLAIDKFGIFFFGTCSYFIFDLLFLNMFWTNLVEKNVAYFFFWICSNRSALTPGQSKNSLATWRTSFALKLLRLMPRLLNVRGQCQPSPAWGCLICDGWMDGWWYLLDGQNLVDLIDLDVE